MRKDTFIRLTSLESKLPISINTTHMIYIGARFERTFKRWVEKRKTLFGFGPEEVINRSCYSGYKEIEGSNIITTQLRLEVKESREEILKLISEARE